MAKMTEAEVENRDLKMSLQNLVIVLREESSRCKKYAGELIEILQDMNKVSKIMDSDQESEQELDALDLITDKYKDINQRLSNLKQFQTKFHQIKQITDRASMKAGGIEKYEHIQFASSNNGMYFQDNKRKTVA